MSDAISGNWQRRWQPLLEQWVIVSARSAARPWSGMLASASQPTAVQHDPQCYLCAGVVRANGMQNPHYAGAYAFDNDFPSLSHDAPPCAREHDDPIMRTATAQGRCRVLCWSERHDATLASLAVDEMLSVAHLWQQEYITLSAEPTIANVLIFENKGTEIGVSNLHPHGQVYATSFVTDTATRMRKAQADYAHKHDNASMLQSLLACVHTQQHLLIDSNDHFSVIVPFAARFAYETWIVPHRHVGSLAGMSEQEINALALIYQRQARRYDRLFQRSAPNITLLHNAPCDDDSKASAMNRYWCFHISLLPPLRDPEKLKFLAGFESGTNNIVNPVQPEIAAQQMRAIDIETQN